VNDLQNNILQKQHFALVRIDVKNAEGDGLPLRTIANH